MTAADLRAQAIALADDNVFGGGLGETLRRHNLALAVLELAIEACAKECDERVSWHRTHNMRMAGVAIDCAAAIRALQAGNG